MFYLQLILAGIATGAIYSLSGMGVVLTYKATGVFNFAHGAVAMFVAYILFQLARQWHWPIAIAGPVVVVVIGPAVGILLERVVFRPLQRIGATTSQKLVATLGVFTILEGIAYAVWTGETRQGPSITPTRPLVFPGGLRMGANQLAIVILVAAVSVLVWLLFRRTHLGTEIRAVVDRRELAELASVNANRVAAVSWAMGTTLAGLAGVLLAPSGLDPAGLTLLVIETFSIAVVARLTSLPVAVGAGIVILGVVQSLLTQVHLFGGSGAVGTAFEQLKPNLSVVVLFVFLMAYRRLDVVGEEAVALVRTYVPRPLGLRERNVWSGLVVVGLLVAPALLDPLTTMAYGQEMLALAIIFVSIVAITGLSGHITLGQAAFAGIGAFGSARLSNALHLPVIVGMIGGGLMAVVAGVIAGFPALRRKGLFLALTTLAFGLLIYNFVLQSTNFAGGYNGLQVRRPEMFSGQRAFYYFELACLGLSVLLARNLRSGRLGRILGAMRDSEGGASSLGVDLRAYKLFIFGASAFLAGIGGALLAQKSQSYSAFDFHPITASLVWFTVVVVTRVDASSGGVIGAVVFVMLDVVLKRPGISELVIGLAALFLGRLPGGNLLGLLAWARERVVAAVRRVGSLEPPDAVRAPVPPAVRRARPELAPSTYARRLLAGLGDPS